MNSDVYKWAQLHDQIKRANKENYYDHSTINEFESDQNNENFTRLDPRQVGSADTDVAVAEHLLQYFGRQNIFADLNFIYFWNERNQEVFEDFELRELVRKNAPKFKDNVSQSLIKNVSEQIKDMVTTKLPPLNVRQGDHVSFENGDLSLENGRWLLRPMKREDYRILRLPFHYNPNATCPRFEQFIKEVFRDDPDIAEKSKLIFELFGYSFQSHTRHELFPILVGNGANGKSVLLYTLAHCVGDQNVTAIQPYSFNNSFQLASLQAA